jgi:hypothetical protein
MADASRAAPPASNLSAHHQTSAAASQRSRRQKAESVQPAMTATLSIWAVPGSPPAAEPSRLGSRPAIPAQRNDWLSRPQRLTPSARPCQWIGFERPIKDEACRDLSLHCPHCCSRCTPGHAACSLLLCGPSHKSAPSPSIVVLVCYCPPVSFHCHE